MGKDGDMSHTTDYIDLINVDLEEIEKLTDELSHWKVVYERRAFDINFPDTIKKMMAQIKEEIKGNIERCEYYINRIKEMSNAKINQTQLNSNKRDADQQREDAGDPDPEPAGIEQEDLGNPYEEADNPWLSDIQR
jgi:hypothetical protein